MTASVATATRTTAPRDANRANESRFGVTAWLQAVETAVYGSFQIIQRKVGSYAVHPPLSVVYQLTNRGLPVSRDMIDYAFALCSTRRTRLESFLALSLNCYNCAPSRCQR